MGTKARKAIQARGKAAALTDIAIRALAPGQKKMDGAHAIGGRLMVRARAASNGRKTELVREFFFRYRGEGNDRLIKLGTYPAMSLRAARGLAETNARLVREGIDPQFHREQQISAEKRRERETKEAKLAIERRGTLADLVERYTSHLRASGKVSADQAHDILTRHVLDPFPALATRPANEITADDVSDAMARMIGKGIERQTNIMRAYLRAAFTYGAKLDNDPRRKAEALKGATSKASKLFAIRGNPVADTPRIAEYDRARDRVLTDDELRHYLQSLGTLHPSIGALLRVALLIGGQRLSQIKRARWTDYDADERILKLRDAKGRGGVRDHLLPVSDRVAKILDAAPRFGEASYIFSTVGGDTQIDLSTLSNAVSAIARVSNKQPKAYSASDLRRTVETRLAQLGVTKDVRAQVLSHGRTSGVQEKHYDRHDYLPEKARALATWEAHLAEIERSASGAKVIKGRFGRAS